MTTSPSATAASVPRASVSLKSAQGPKRTSRLSTRLAGYLGLALLIYILVVWTEARLVRLPHDLVGTPAPGERIGVVHIHTRASDGSGTIPEITATARGLGLSFMAITDHNVAMAPIAPVDDPPDFAVIPGEELTTPNGHFLALGVPPGWERPRSSNTRELLAAAHAAGAFNVIAHPFHTNIPWTYWQTSDFDGIEVLNEDEVWRRDRWMDLADAILVWGINPQLAVIRLARRPAANFAKWDELLAQRPVAGMCGTDAHAAISANHHILLRFPSYGSAFLAAREHVLLPPSAGGGDPSRAGADEILDALRHGRSFCSLDAIYPAGGFTSSASSGGASAGPGELLNWAKSGTLHVAVPSGAPRPLIRVIHDGKEMMEKEDWTLDTPLDGPGKYRTEIYLQEPGLLGWGRRVLWIFSNPVYVTSDPGLTSASAAAPANR